MKTAKIWSMDASIISAHGPHFRSFYLQNAVYCDKCGEVSDCAENS